MDEPSLPPPQPLFDLTGMGPEDAKDYVLSLVTHLKQTESALKIASEELNLWEARGALAQKQGREDLREQAQTMASQAASRKATLELEVQDFRAGVEKVKKQLLLLPMTQRTVNTDVLQENLARLGGTLDPVTPTVKNLQAEEALAALKKRIADSK